MRETVVRVAGSVVLFAGVAVVYLVSVWTHRGQQIDQRAYDGVRGSDSWRDMLHRFGFERITDPRLWVLAAAVVILLGVMSHRRGSILALLVLPVVAVVIARLLRTVILPRPELLDIVRASFNTYPSGHTAAAAGCVAAAIRAAPRALSPVISVVGAMWVTVVGQGLMEVGAHRPSDIVGSLFLVSGLLVLVPTPTRSRGVGPAVAVVTAVVGMVPPLFWAVHTGHVVLGAIGVAAAAAFACLVVGPTRAGRRDATIIHTEPRRAPTSWT